MIITAKKDDNNLFDPSSIVGCSGVLGSGQKGPTSRMPKQDAGLYVGDGGVQGFAGVA